MSPASSFEGDLALALELAELADGISLPRFRAHNLKITTKPDATPVTDADLAVEAAIRDRLAEARPADGILGEESGLSAGDAPRQWIVDPIDGTKSFLRGVPVWATLIALETGGAVVVGVVSAPALGRRWWASAGSGAFSESGRLAVSGVAELADASVSYSDLTGWGARRQAMLALLDGVWRSRAYGDFWSYALLAEGVVDVAVEPEVSAWDLAALDILVREAGGRFTGLDGTLGPRAGSALATNGLLHEAALERLRG